MADETTSAAQEPQTTPSLTIQDLSLTLQVIQLASSRGSFKAEEMSAVGGLYDRVFKFLEASNASQQSPKTDAVVPSEPPAKGE